MVTNVVEAAGWGLLVLFAYLCWPPAAVLVAGVELIVWANTRTPVASGGRVGAFIAAARAAYQAQRRGPEEIGPGAVPRSA